MLTPITRIYSDFAGVDFSNDSSRVALNRSPDSVNIYKNYKSTQGKCIETRPGYKKKAKIGTNINGLYIFNNLGSKEAIVHSGNRLYKWDNFPSEPETKNIIELFSNMKDEKSSFFLFANKLYICDGLNYLEYNGTEIRSVEQNAFIPTTSIGREPSGGGEIYQQVNLLQPKRINTFIADGTSKDYFLDATEIDSVNEIKVNDVLITEYSVNKLLGKVTFSTAPDKPGIDGQANVSITYTKTVEDYINRIKNCTIALTFDRRVFFSGNPDFPNAVFHSELENPGYIGDLRYYQDGTDTSAIKSVTVGNNILWVFKESNQQNATIFYHVPTTDSNFGRIYPSKQGNISAGCYSTSCNFNDDIVFMSKQGLEGITGDINQEQLLSHRSSLVDSKLTNTESFEKCEMQEWEGYLLCLVDGQVFLADSRQKYSGINGFEYEWYYWDNIGCEESKATIIKEYKGTLIFGCSNGDICIFEGTNDNGNAIYSSWTMPRDFFGYENHLKTTNKRGGIAKIKTIPNGKVKISESTDKTDEKLVKTFSATGFEYGNVDYSNFSYTTKQDSHVVFKIKEKKIIEIALKFYSNELDKPFGLYSATLEAFLGSYVKR